MAVKPKAKVKTKPKGRTPAIPMYPGKMMGFLRIVQKVNTKPGSSGGQRYRVECTAPHPETGKICGQRITLPVFYMVRPFNPRRHCGCLARKAKPYQRERRIWTMMNYRCQNPKHTAYIHYGGAGICVCEKWHRDMGEEGFDNFLKDMGPCPTDKHSLDRIDPYGNYEPGNCRWATATEQANNQKKHWLPPSKRAEAQPTEVEE